MWGGTARVVLTHAIVESTSVRSFVNVSGGIHHNTSLPLLLNKTDEGEENAIHKTIYLPGEDEKEVLAGTIDNLLKDRIGRLTGP